MARQPSPRPLPRRSQIALARLVGLLALAAAIFSAAPESTARLQPYYLVRGTASGQINPRVLFAVDTSGSMVWWPDADGCPYSQQNRSRQCDCAWNECEDTSDPSKMSRIAGARAAIRAVVEGTEGAADFALMTFGSVKPPADATEIPDTCSGGARFAWVEEATAYAGRQNAFGPWADAAPPGQSSAQPGVWALCGENRPFPYLRADELGITVPGTFDADNLPAGPLHAAWGGTWSSWTNNAVMSSRRVQWLPAFMGVHFRIPCAEVSVGDPRSSRSQGDYTSGETCGQDFFYVPYADGFSGYSAMNGYSNLGNVRMGIHERAFDIARLDLHHRGAFGDQRIKAGERRGNQTLKPGFSGGGNGGNDTAAGTRDLFVAGALKPHLELTRTVAAKNDVGMAVDETRRDEPTLKVTGHCELPGQLAFRPDPGNPAIGNDNSPVLHQPIGRPAGHHRGDTRVPEKKCAHWETHLACLRRR